jgi:glycosyltransferase involved in cell wall biosynthesis
MDVSVIIPTKDRLSSLKRVLPAFLMQKEVREIVVVVDGSTDGTLEYLEDLCRDSDVVRYIDNGVNRGLPFSRNVGIDAAKYEYIFMAEDDLELTENFLETLSGHMTSIGADVICGRTIYRGYTEAAEASIIRSDKFTGPYVNMKTIEVETGFDIRADQVEPILAAQMLAKTSLFREIRYSEIYRENFWREETDFQLAAREHGYTLACCPHAVCFNFVISNDRGGAYAAVGVRREMWVIINNWKFFKKHENFIRDNFNTGDKRIYIFKFAVVRVVKYILLPPIIHVLSRAKRRVLGTSVS